MCVYTQTVTSNMVMDCSADFVELTGATCYTTDPPQVIAVTISGNQITIDPGGSRVNLPAIVTAVGTGIIPL